MGLIIMSLVNDHVPQSMMKAEVLALHKSGEKSDIGYDRPFPVLPIMSKSLERGVNDHLYNFTNDNELMHPIISVIKIGRQSSP